MEDFAERQSAKIAQNFLIFPRQIKDFRRIAMCSDKLAANFISSVAPAKVLAFWLCLGLGPNIRWRQS